MKSSCLDINREGKRPVRLCLRPCLGVIRNVAFAVIALWSRSDSNSEMTSFHARIPSVGDRVPDSLRTWMAPFRPFFTAPVWERALVLLMGAMLAPGKRTVSSALRITGRAMAFNFTCYHQVLNRARWSSLAMTCRLLTLIIDRLVPDGPVVIGIDDTIERRWGPKIAARGIYRDPVRSSHAHFVKTSGLRWLSFMVLCPVPWANRVKALPFLSILAPSERSNRAQGKVHKRLTDWARQGILQICRWLPQRRLVFVGDSGFAVLDLLASVRRALRRRQSAAPGCEPLCATAAARASHPRQTRCQGRTIAQAQDRRRGYDDRLAKNHGVPNGTVTIDANSISRRERGSGIAPVVKSFR